MTLYNSHNMCISNKHSHMMLTSVVGLVVLVSFSVAGIIPAVPTYNDFMNRIMINRNDWTRDSINKTALTPASKTSGVLSGILPGILPGVLPGNYPEISPDSLPPVPKAEGSLTDKPKPQASPASKPKCSKAPLYGMCEMRANPNIPSNINGTIYLRQDVNENCEYNFLNVQVNIDSVPMNDETTKHGFHIHTFGDLSGGCESMGPHYNPFNSKHGAPWNKSGSRHVGDFGNVIQRGKKGAIQTRIVDYLAKLHGEHSIYGRGMVLHEKKDDLGLGGNPGSEATGNAGRRLACCVIGKSPPHSRSRYNLY